MLALILISSILATGLHCELLNAGEEEMQLYQIKSKVLHRLIKSQCPQYSLPVKDTASNDTLASERDQYQNLFAKLQKCREEIEAKKALLKTPIECTNAVNFDQHWRANTDGLEWTPGGPHSYDNYNCDFHTDIKWFRFTGKAGNRMLNTCPSSSQTCGTTVRYWTNAVMPVTVGVRTAVKVYGKYRSSCYSRTKQMLVMRCSPAVNDFIYLIAAPPFSGSLESGRCNSGVCGMLN